jgi:hypothetical protein
MISSVNRTPVTRAERTRCVMAGEPAYRRIDTPRIARPNTSRWLTAKPCTIRTEVLDSTMTVTEGRERPTRAGYRNTGPKGSVLNGFGRGHALGSSIRTEPFESSTGPIQVRGDRASSLPAGISAQALARSEPVTGPTPIKPSRGGSPRHSQEAAVGRYCAGRDGCGIASNDGGLLGVMPAWAGTATRMENVVTRHRLSQQARPASGSPERVKGTGRYRAVNLGWRKHREPVRLRHAGTNSRHRSGSAGED